jgi:hypothetical protein
MGRSPMLSACVARSLHVHCNGGARALHLRCTCDASATQALYDLVFVYDYDYVYDYV